jgi:hypothetical protein
VKWNASPREREEIKNQLAQVMGLEKLDVANIGF